MFFDRDDKALIQYKHFSEAVLALEWTGRGSGIMKPDLDKGSKKNNSLMAKEVIGRGGKRQPFKADKIKRAIRLACKDARVPGARIKGVVSKVSRPVLKFAAKRKTVKTAVIRKKVLAGLRKAEPAAAKAWLKYEKRRRARRRK